MCVIASLAKSVKLKSCSNTISPVAPSTMPKLARGSFVILLMCFVALGLSIFAAWFRHNAGDAALRFWGKEAGLRIRSAEIVKLLEIVEPASGEVDNKQCMEIEGKKFAVTASKDITSARGLIHARHALLEDASLDEAAKPAASQVNRWHRVIEFVSKDGAKTSVAIDLDTGWLCNIENGGLIKLKEPQRSLVAYVKKLAPRQKDIEEAEAKLKMAKELQAAKAAGK